MCCFSVHSRASLRARLFPPKVHVSKTNILARMIRPGVQALAYGMDLETSAELAMILPLPVVPGSGEDAVRFVSLEAHPRMFDELDELFDVLPPALGFRGRAAAAVAPQPKLVVHEVGAFVASYVPTRADFGRLDERFRLPEVLFDAVPAYDDHGFAVFQLAPGKVRVHPMALTFPTRVPERLFFPTVHLHDGRFRATAKFDHSLYYQGIAAVGDVSASLPLRSSYQQLLDPREKLHRRKLRGKLANQDTWIDPVRRGTR